MPTLTYLEAYMMHNSGKLEVYLKVPYITVFVGRIFVVTPAVNILTPLGYF